MGKAEKIKEELRRQEVAEDTNKRMEELLGTDEQLSGAYTDPRLVDFVGRYETEAKHLKGIDRWKNRSARAWKEDHARPMGKEERAAWKAEYKKFKEEELTGNKFLDATLNRRLQEAEDLARTGDYEGAAAIKSEIQTMIEKKGTRGAEKYNYFQDSRKQALLNLGNQQGMTLGRLTQDAGELTNRDSAEYQRLLTDITNPYVEGLRSDRDVEIRNLVRQARQLGGIAQELGLRTGEARGAFAEQAFVGKQRRGIDQMIGAIQTGVAGEEAALHGRATSWLNQYAEKLSTDVRGLNREWLAGTPFVRENFQKIMEERGLQQGNQYSRIAALFQQNNPVKPRQSAAELGIAALGSAVSLYSSGGKK